MTEVSTDLVLSAASQLILQGIEKAEKTMLAKEQVSCPVRHFFGPGVYIRELQMKAGTLAIGHYQRFPHTNVFVKGKVAMFREDGSTIELTAPMTFVGQPGRKMGYVIEDVVWQNIYATDLQDVESVEAYFLDKSPMWQEAEIARAVSLHATMQGARDDFVQMVEDSGFTPELVWRQSSNPFDQISMPQGVWNFKLGPSPIHGTGIFLTSDAACGTIVGPARIGGLRTPLGRFTNHHPEPNAVFLRYSNGDIDLVLTKDCRGCQGGFDGDEITVDYRQALSLSGIQTKGTK